MAQRGRGTPDYDKRKPQVGPDEMAATQYVAFLRAVNVGGRIVKMAELKKIFEAAGLAEVATFIASGNVIFRSPKVASGLEGQIERALQNAWVTR